MEREYSSVDDLKDYIKQAFELKSSSKELKLSYLDEDNDQLDILSTDDLKVAVENAVKRGINLKIKVDLQEQVDIEEIESEDEQSETPVNLPPFIEQLKQSIIDLKLDDEDPVIVEEGQSPKREEMKEEDNEILYDFKFADLFAKVEDVINNKEDVGPRDIMDAVREAVRGTHAQRVVKKFFKKFRKGHCGPLKAVKKALKKAKEHAKKNKRGAQEVPIDQRVHERITCDSCEQSPIVGIRYKCAECPNFDLCAKCEENGVHSHHTFLKVKVP